jgi:hypothetical protein
VLEDQMSTFTSDLDRKRTKTSPDRVDALVWGLTELQIDPSGNTGMLDYYRSLYEKQVGKKDAQGANASRSRRNAQRRDDVNQKSRFTPPASCPAYAPRGSAAPWSASCRNLRQLRRRPIVATDQA